MRAHPDSQCSLIFSHPLLVPVLSLSLLLNLLSASIWFSHPTLFSKMYAHVWVHAYKPWHMSDGQRTTLGSLLLPSCLRHHCQLTSALSGISVYNPTGDDATSGSTGVLRIYSGPHTYMTGTVSTEPPPQPDILSFFLPFYSVLPPPSPMDVEGVEHRRREKRELLVIQTLTR